MKSSATVLAEAPIVTGVGTQTRSPHSWVWVNVGLVTLIPDSPLAPVAIASGESVGSAGQARERGRGLGVTANDTGQARRCGSRKELGFFRQDQLLLPAIFFSGSGIFGVQWCRCGVHETSCSDSGSHFTPPRDRQNPNPMWSGIRPVQLSNSVVVFLSVCSSSTLFLRRPSSTFLSSVPQPHARPHQAIRRLRFPTCPRAAVSTANKRPMHTIMSMHSYL